MYVRSLIQQSKIRTVLFLAVFGLTLGGTASAQVTPAAGYTPPDDTPALRVGMTFYGNYTYQSWPKLAADADGNTANANSFDVTRSYLNFTGNLSHIVAFRLTPDITRATSIVSSSSVTTNSLVFRVKYAYAQFNLDDWTRNWKQTWVRIGANQTPYVDWDEGVYRYRFQGTVFTERVGRLTSSDYGVSVHTNLPDNYGEIHTGVYNGEGYSTAETNGRKAFQTRVTIRPLPKGGMTMRGLRVTGFYDKDNYLRNDVKERFVFKALFEHPHIVASFDYMDATDRTTAASSLLHGRGYSIWATPIFKQKGNGPELLLRWDSYTPSRGAEDSTNKTKKQNVLIVGPSYWFPHQGTVSASLLGDLEVVTFPGSPQTGSTVPTRKYALHAFLNF